MTSAARAAKRHAVVVVAISQDTDSYITFDGSPQCSVNLHNGSAPGDTSTELRATDAAERRYRDGRHLSCGDISVMSGLINVTLETESDRHEALGQALSLVRWVAIAILFLLTLATPVAGRTALSDWMLILLFGFYNLVLELARTRVARPWSFGRTAVVDLPVTVLLYGLGSRIGGVLFALLVLSIICVASNTTLRGSLPYTGLVMVLMTAIAPTFPTVVGIRQELP